MDACNMTNIFLKKNKYMHKNKNTKKMTNDYQNLHEK